MVFVSSELGEHSITTRDIDVNENTIIQFEVHKHSFDDFFFKATVITLTHSRHKSGLVILCVSMYLQINVGCTAESSSTHPVRLEFSRDFGATWHLLVPLCAGAPQPSALCSTELHPASIYFPGTTQGWRREVIHFGKLRLCG